MCKSQVHFLLETLQLSEVLIGVSLAVGDAVEGAPAVEMLKL